MSRHVFRPSWVFRNAQRARSVGPWASGSPIRDTVRQAGKSRLADTFAGPFELSPPPRTCIQMLSMHGQVLGPSASSVHLNLVLLVGKTGDFGSSVRALMVFCMSSAVFSCTATPYVSVHMFGVPAWLLELSQTL